MKQSIVKFLEFNGKNLLFLSKSGVTYVAVKPVCEAIGVNYNRQFQNINEDPILSPVFAIQQMQVPGDQIRKMVCLPERYIYGWIFSIRSESKELIEFKLECYDILFNHFHGTMTGRKEILQEKVKTQARLRELEQALNHSNDFKEYQDKKAYQARLGISMKIIEKRELDEVADLFTGTGDEM
jgi:hypothetical protein